MTEEFKKRMEEAIKKGVLVTKKQDEEHLKKAADNQKYANYYMALVIAAIETFNYFDCVFDEDKIDKDVIKIFGKPKSIDVGLTTIDGRPTNDIGIIYLNYGKNGGFGREGEPKFKKEKEFNYEIINEILEENGISVKETHIDCGGMGDEEDIITFDASALLEKRKELKKEQESSKEYKKK